MRPARYCRHGIQTVVNAPPLIICAYPVPGESADNSARTMLTGFSADQLLIAHHLVTDLFQPLLVYLHALYSPPQRGALA
jgi:hypothetical protein